MSDTSINQIIQYGTNAERIAYTPDPPSGVQTLYLWYETDNAPDFYVWNGAAWVQVNAAGAGGINQLTGDVTAGPGVGSQAATIAANAVTNAKLAEMATLTIKGNNTGGTTEPLDLTAAEVTAILNVFSDVLQGLVPASGGGTTNFLRADGTWAAAGGGGGGDLLLATVDIDNTEILSLNSVPIEIIAAPGANMIAVPVQLSIFMNNPVGYSTTAGLRLRYNGITTELVSAIAAISGIANDKYFIRNSIDISDLGATANDYINKSIQLSSSTDVTGGDAANFIRISVAYYILDLT